MGDITYMVKKHVVCSVIRLHTIFDRLNLSFPIAHKRMGIQSIAGQWG